MCALKEWHGKFSTDLSGEISWPPDCIQLETLWAVDFGSLTACFAWQLCSAWKAEKPAETYRYENCKTKEKFAIRLMWHRKRVFLGVCRNVSYHVTGRSCLHTDDETRLQIQLCCTDFYSCFCVSSIITWRIEGDTIKLKDQQGSGT